MMLADTFDVRVVDTEGKSYRRDVRLEYLTDDPFAVRLYANGSEHAPWNISREMLWQAVGVGVGAGPIGDGDVVISVTPNLVVVLLRGEDGTSATLRFSRVRLRRYLLKTLDDGVGGVPLGSEWQHYDIDAEIARLLTDRGRAMD